MCEGASLLLFLILQPLSLSGCVLSLKTKSKKKPSPLLSLSLSPSPSLPV
jgi:hypothetical protein